jgi:hypothetical protein
MKTKHFKERQEEENRNKRGQRTDMSYKVSTTAFNINELHLFSIKMHGKPDTVVFACNPSYSGG